MGSGSPSRLIRAATAAHDLFAVHPDGSGLKQLYSNGDRNSQPVWSSDGKSLLFAGGSPFDGATWEIWRLDIDSGGATALTHNDMKDSSPAFAPDGSIVYLSEGDGHAALAHMDGDGANARVLYDGAGYDWGAAYSPSGDLITFTSDVSGRDEIYLMNADGTDIRRGDEFRRHGRGLASLVTSGHRSVESNGCV